MTGIMATRARTANNTATCGPEKLLSRRGGLNANMSASVAFSDRLEPLFIKAPLLGRLLPVAWDLLRARPPADHTNSDQNARRRRDPAPPVHTFVEPALARES